METHRPSSAWPKGGNYLVVVDAVVVVYNDVVVAVPAVSSESAPWDSEAIAVVAHGVADEPSKKNRTEYKI